MTVVSSCSVRFWLGPIECSLLDGKLTEGSSKGKGRPVSITGVAADPVGLQLAELIASPDSWVTVGDVTGVVEPAYFDWDAWRGYSGWWVFTDVQVGQAFFSGRHAGSLRELSLSGVFLGPRAPVVVSRSRTIPNDFGVIGKGQTADPLYAENADGSNAFVTMPGTVYAYPVGLSTTREYDHRPMVSLGANTEPRVGVTPPVGRKMTIGIG